MEYRYVYYIENQEKHGRWTDQERAFNEKAFMQIQGCPAWVEDEEHNKVVEMTAEEIIEREG